MNLWQQNCNIHHFPTLNEDKRVDVLIVGGGLTGILTAYELQKKGIDYILVEANQIGQGKTGHSTAKITSQHGFIYHTLIEEIKNQGAKDYYDIHQLALKRYVTLAKQYDFDLKVCDNYVFSNSQKDIDKERHALDQLNIPYFIKNHIDIPVIFQQAIGFKDQLQMNPLKLIQALSKNLHIYENSPIQKIKGHFAYCQHYRIHAKKIIIASHFPIINKHGEYFMKMYQSRSYEIAYTGIKPLQDMYIDNEEKGLSLRSYQDYFIICGGDHQTGYEGGKFQELESFMKTHYQNYQEVARWSNQDCMTLDHIPYIGLYYKRAEYLYVATGYNKWGMSTSMVAAMILSDIILGKRNQYSYLFDPSRHKKTFPLLSNLYNASKNLLVFAQPRCSHMGCRLKWNETTQSFDCPCHGSRFDKYGHILDNPAVKRKKF